MEIKILRVYEIISSGKSIGVIIAGFMFAIIATTFLTSITFPVYADDETVDLGDFVVTGTRSESLLLDMAGNTDVIKQEDIDLVNPDHPSELLNRAAGTYVHQNNGQESLVSIRSPVLTGGGGAGAFLFMEDGVPLRASGFTNVNGLAEVNMEQSGGVEIVRGPGSAFYGSNAVHGLVNVLTRTPSLEPERKIAFSKGPHGLYKGSASMSDTLGSHAYRLSFTDTHDGGYRDNSDVGLQKVVARYDYYGATTTVKTVFSGYNLNQETAGFIISDDNTANGGSCYTSSRSDETLYKDESAMRKNCDPDAYRDWYSYRLSSNMDFDLADGKRLSITPYARTNNMEFRMHFLPSRAIEENEHSSVGLLTSYYWDMPAGHRVIIGTDIEYTKGGLTETQEQADFTFIPFPGAPASRQKARPQGVHYDYDVDAIVVAPYIHTEWQVMENLRVTAGLRYEYTHYDYDNKIANGTLEADGTSCIVWSTAAECLFNRPADRTDEFNNISPKLGMSYRFAESHSFFINATSGFRAPQVTELYRLQKDQVVGEVDSEDARSIEGGIRGKNALFSYELLAYYMKKKNTFFRAPDGTNVTNGETDHKGVELGFFMSLFRYFDIAGNYTYAVHKYTFDLASSGIVDGNDVDTAPRHLSNFRLGWNFMPQGRAELEWRHVNKYFLDPSNAHEYEGHDLLNLRASKIFNNGVGIYGKITNLTDTRYASRSDFAFGAFRFFGGEPRSLHLGLNYAF